MSNLPAYFMSPVFMPMVIREKLDRIQRDFHWEGRSEKRKSHLMMWDNMTKPKGKGGLEIGNFKFKILLG